MHFTFIHGNPYGVPLLTCALRRTKKVSLTIFKASDLRYLAFSTLNDWAESNFDFLKLSSGRHVTVTWRHQYAAR